MKIGKKTNITEYLLQEADIWKEKARVMSSSLVSQVP